MSRRLGTVNANLYGSTWDWRDAAIGGIWVADDPSIPQVDGFHRGAIEALDSLSVPVIQFFPQSPFYDWEDAVGPREKRPRQLLPWGRIRGHPPVEVSNDVGTDEFTRFCRLIGAEPFFDTNEFDPLGSKNWVEYCNFDGDTKYARLRREHGHRDPHGVKYWHVYAWADLDPVAHAIEFRKFASIARLVDPTIRVIASGAGGAEWMGQFFETVERSRNALLAGSGLVDDLAFMHYFGVMMPDVDFTDEEYYCLMRNTEGLDSALGEHDTAVRYHSTRRQPWGHGWIDEPYASELSTEQLMGMVVAEWAVSWATKTCTLRDAIAAASILDTYHRWASRVHMALAYNLTSGQALVQTDRAEVWVTPTYHVFDMYKPHRGNESVTVEVLCDNIDIQTEGGDFDFLASMSVSREKPLPILSSSASISPNGKELVLSVTNRDLSDTVRVEVSARGEGAPRSGRRTLLTAESVRAHNDAANPERVRPSTSEQPPTDGKFVIDLPPASVTTLVSELG